MIGEIPSGIKVTSTKPRMDEHEGIIMGRGVGVNGNRVFEGCVTSVQGQKHMSGQREVDRAWAIREYGLNSLGDASPKDAGGNGSVGRPGRANL